MSILMSTTGVAITPIPRLACLSCYQGESDYRVIDGTLAGQRIRVRWFKAEIDAKQFAPYRTPAANHEREQSAGCVVGPDDRHPVPYPVLLAVRQMAAERSARLVTAGMATEHYATALSACRWSPEAGFVPVDDVDIPGYNTCQSRHLDATA